MEGSNDQKKGALKSKASCVKRKNERMFIKEQMSNEKVLKKSFDEVWSTEVLC